MFIHADGRRGSERNRILNLSRGIGGISAKIRTLAQSDKDLGQKFYWRDSCKFLENSFRLEYLSACQLRLSILQSIPDAVLPLG